MGLVRRNGQSITLLFTFIYSRITKKGYNSSPCIERARTENAVPGIQIVYWFPDIIRAETKTKRGRTRKTIFRGKHIPSAVFPEFSGSAAVWTARWIGSCVFLFVCLARMSPRWWVQSSLNLVGFFSAPQWFRFFIYSDGGVSEIWVGVENIIIIAMNREIR